MNIYVPSSQWVVELHTNEEANTGVIELEDGTEIKCRNIHLGETSLILSIDFKDLTIYDIASFKQRRASLMDMEKNDGNDRGDS